MKPTQDDKANSKINDEIEKMAFSFSPDTLSPEYDSYIAGAQAMAELKDAEIAELKFELDAKQRPLGEQVLELTLENQALRAELDDKTEVLEHLQRELNNGQALEPEGPNHRLINYLLTKHEGGKNG